MNLQVGYCRFGEGAWKLSGSLKPLFKLSMKPSLPLSRNRSKTLLQHDHDIGALIIRIGFWGILYYSYNKEPPKIVQVMIKAPT